MRMKTVAIVPAAGLGKRLKAADKKPFVILGGKPLITYSLKALDSCGWIDAIIVAAEAHSMERLKDIIKKHGFKKVFKVVKGGSTRAESVKNCFKAISSDCDIVVIHDGARPFLEAKAIRDSIACAKKFGACVTAVPVTDTVKMAGNDFFVKNTVDRKHLWKAQTPQAFRYEVLKKAFGRVNNAKGVTDDAMLVERLGIRVKILEGWAGNIKITTKEDLKLAEVLL